MPFVGKRVSKLREFLGSSRSEKSATRFTKIQNDAYLRLSKSQARTGKAEIPTLHRKSLGTITIHALSALSCNFSPSFEDIPAHKIERKIRRKIERKIKRKIKRKIRRN